MKHQAAVAERSSVVELFWILSFALASVVVANLLIAAEKGTPIPRKPEFLAREYYDR
jgi:hypothetical protein